MSSIFQMAMGAAFKAQQLTRGVSATYTVDGSTTISNLKIVPAVTTRENVGEDGVVLSSRFQDWLILVADLLGNIPKRSHRITVNSEVFALVELENEKPFRFHNPPDNTIYRIHTELRTGDPG